MQQLFLARQKGIVVAGEVEQPAAVELDDAGRQGAQESAVVGDEYQGDAGAQQEILQPGDRLDVEMVGRLVQQQQVRLAHQRPGQQHPPLHPAGEARHGRLGRQLETGDHLLGALLQFPASPLLQGVLGRQQFGKQPLVATFGQESAEVMIAAQPLAGRPQPPGDHLEDAPRHLPRHILRQDGRPQPLPPVDDPGIRRQVAGQQPQQTRLAGAVAPEQADPLPRLDLQAHRVEQGCAAEGQGNIA